MSKSERSSDSERSREKNKAPDAEARAGDALNSGGIARGEWLVFSLIMVIAIGLRFFQIDQVTVEHFDEGVYASGIFCSHLEPPDDYPLRHLYAPPLWPAILKETATWFRPSAVIIPGAIAGVLSVALLWWVARQWYGPTGAVVASSLLAMSDIHVMFSRSALTDVPMTLLMLAGVYAGWKSMLERSNAWLVVAGLCAGLAWSTKYNGWLTLAVIGSASVAWRLVERNDHEVVATRPVIRWLVIVAIACVVWSPVLIGLQKLGGYASVSQNHGQYFVGPVGWWDSAMKQLQMAQVAAESGTLWPVVALVGFGLLAIRPLAAATSFFIAAVLGTRLRLLTNLVPALGTSAKSLSNLRRGAAQTQSRKLATWMTLAWIGGLAVAIPLYTPYLRLVVPLLPVGALAWADLGTRHDIVNWSSRRHVTIAVVLLVTTFSCRTASALLWPLKPTSAEAIALRDQALEEPADVILDAIMTDAQSRMQPSHRGIALYVYGEPATFFHLAAQEGTRPIGYISQPAANLGILDPSRTDPSLLSYVVIGPHESEKDWSPDDEGRLEELLTVRRRDRLLVALDELDPAEVRENGGLYMPEVSVYRIRSISE